MYDYLADSEIVAQIETLREALPVWVLSTVVLIELAQNAERAAAPINPETAVRSRALVVEVAEWQHLLTNWQGKDISPRLKAELRILKATLEASMDEANAAAGQLRLFD
jgi:hypothetical protein